VTHSAVAPCAEVLFARTAVAELTPPEQVDDAFDRTLAESDLSEVMGALFVLRICKRAALDRMAELMAGGVLNRELVIAELERLGDEHWESVRAPRGEAAR
jgi:hypothetical protein